MSKPEGAGGGARSLERQVVAICSRVSGFAALGEDSDIFGLGAGGFDAARVAWLVEDAFDVDVEPAEVILARTPMELAALVERKRAVAGPRPAPLSTSQEPMLWHEQLTPGSFNMAPLVRRHRGPLDMDCLAEAFAGLLRRHEPLRTTFQIRRGRAVQVVTQATGAMDLAVHDLSGLAGPAAAERARHLITEAAGLPFDLERQPGFQPLVIRLGTQDHLVVVRLHHSAFDDWSVGIYRRELSALYEASLDGSPSGLDDPHASFSGFARAQRRALAGPAGAGELDWWRSELAGAPLGTQLDIAGPEGTWRSGPSQAVQVSFPPALAASLRNLARHSRASIFMTLLAGFQLLMHRSTGDEDLMISTVVANRDQARLEGLIGCFTKKLPLRLRLVGDPSFVDLVGQVRESLTGALAHQQLGYETILQDVLGPAAADHGVVPHFPIMFQGLVPAPGQLRLPGLSGDVFATSPTQGPGLHLVGTGHDGTPGEAAAPERPWGGRLYPGTFLAISVVDDGESLGCVVQGGFHRPSVEALMAGYREVLAAVVAGPLRPVSEVIGRPASRRTQRFRGLELDVESIEGALSSLAGLAGARVAVETSGTSLEWKAPRDALLPSEFESSGWTEPSVVVRVAPGGEGVSLRQVRCGLWEALPGSIWPSRLVWAAGDDVEEANPDPGTGRAPSGEVGPGRAPFGGGAPFGEAPDTPGARAGAAEAMLEDAWATALGVGALGLGSGANYWHCLSFLEAVAPLRLEGILSTDQVARNRTIGTLAADVAAAGVHLEPLPPGRAAPVVPLASQAAGVPVEVPVAAAETVTPAAPEVPDAVPEPPTRGVPASVVEPASVAEPTTRGRGDEVIRVEGLVKVYASGLKAVEGVDLSVRRGEIFGLLGPNGAGKSTTVGMMTTRVIPTGGRIWVAGVDVVADPALAKQFMGVVPQANNLDNSLTVVENLYYHGRYFGMGAKAARSTAEEMLERFRLSGRGKNRVDHLSGGMARRLMLARALMQGPAIVFLDEPTAGLDPQSRLALWDIISDLHADGQTILLTTHYMEEAERFCNRVAIMDHGHILALGTPTELRQSLGARPVLTIKGDGDLERLAKRLDRAGWAEGATLVEGGLRVSLEAGDGGLAKVMAEAESSGVRVTDLALMEDSLEAVFINLTGRELRE